MRFAAVTPEARLLLACAAPEPVGEGAFAEITGRHDFDWPLFAWLVEREHAVPVVWKQLRTRGPGAVPHAVAARFQQLTMVSEFRMLRLRQRLDDAIAVLSRERIGIVLLKGAALGETVYSSFAERPMVDVDMLVERADAERARELLLGAGWHWARNEQLDAFYRHHHHLPPLDDTQGTQTSIELHTDLFLAGHPFRFSAESIRRDAVRSGTPDRHVSVPSTQHQLLHACLHFAWSHMMSSAGWRTFRDLSTIARSTAVDWAAFVRLAVEARGASCCYWTLRLARRAGCEVAPQEVLRTLRPALPGYVLDRLETHFMAQLFAVQAPCPSVRVVETMWELAIRPGASGHGSVRPWDHAAEYRAAILAEQPTPALQKLGQHLVNHRGWTDYLKMLMLPEHRSA